MKGIVFSGALSACLAIGFCAAVCEASGATDLELRDAKTGNAGGLQATRSVKVDTKQRRALLKPATGNRVTAASRARDRASQPKSSASLDGLRATRTSGDLKGPGGCGPECDNCWIGTAFEDNCNPAWEGDGQCDCGCQFADGDDCGAPDLIIQSSGRSPSTGMTPGESIYIEHTVLNQGTGDADDPFWATWYLSTDLNVTIDDYAIAFHDIASLESGASVAASSNPQDPVLWPDVAPYNTPGAIYYVAVMADDLDEIVEGDETNNWGAVWPVVLAGGDTTCPGTGGCCQENETSGCDDASCCETVCTVNASCCDLVWTQTCADLAEDLCTVLCSGDPGCPGEGDCCGPNGTTGCDDASCCNIVCAADPFCCNTEWDVTCAISAEELCTGCPGLPADQYEPDNFPGTGTAVNCGVTQTHTIPVDGDVDWFAITLQPGDDLVAETFNLSGANPDTVMELYDAGCNLLLGDDDSGSEAFASRIQWTAAFAGVYFIKVRTFGGVLDECNDQGGGPKSCQYDINFDCGSCCNPPFLAGDRVRLNVDDPGGAADLPAGTCGTVACCASSDPAEPILVSWDNWNGGHNDDEGCDVVPTPFPLDSGWWMGCDQMVADESCGPVPPSNPSVPDGATQVPVDVTLCWNEAAQVSKVIYGADDRLDVYEVSDPDLLGIADSTVAVFARSAINNNGDGTYSLPNAPTLEDTIFGGTGYPICESEPFPQQPATAFCSGFLVSDELLVTAGHCITTVSECAASAFVFGYEMLDASTPVLTVPQSDVYFCDAIVDRVQVEGGADWAVIRLDRQIVGHNPLPIRRNDAVSLGQPLVMFGHPMGLPQKIAGGATVRENGQAAYFQANVDAYGGNSGSAVVNATTLEVEGILVRGNIDFAVVGNECVASNQCPDSTGCPQWESCTRVTEFEHLVPVTQVREYDIVFEACDGNGLAITTTTTERCWTPPTLDPNTRYCWQVTERDETGETSGPVWSFTTVCGTNLIEASPAHDQSLCRSANNVVRLAFDQDIAVPADGEVKIRALEPAGGFGANLSSSFAFFVENDGAARPRVLRIEENGDILAHRTWYAITSHSWSDVCDFELHYPVQVGDSSRDGRVLGFDVSLINTGIPDFNAADHDCRDVDGDGQILESDAIVTNGSIPSFPLAKPTVH